MGTVTVVITCKYANVISAPQVLDTPTCNPPLAPQLIEATLSEQQLFDAILELQLAVTPTVRDMLAEHEAEQQV